MHSWKNIQVNVFCCLFCISILNLCKLNSVGDCKVPFPPLIFHIYLDTRKSEIWRLYTLKINLQFTKQDPKISLSLQVHN